MKAKHVQNITITNYKQICLFKLSLDITKTLQNPTTRESTLANIILSR